MARAEGQGSSKRSAKARQDHRTGYDDLYLPAHGAVRVGAPTPVARAGPGRLGLAGELDRVGQSGPPRFSPTLITGAGREAFYGGTGMCRECRMYQVAPMNTPWLVQVQYDEVLEHDHDKPERCSN